ncbi:hypothetical protein LOK49_LG10G02833 [Camellia lanceoleosa]|uniref:Uncharacterized protein n=1 Tax=Camellia lanceoleosa TaxID=1840588 RepID=A0ACC0G806_9ERIC|nr:hypothetical protein LOK49_LG10G02833 [Camellia lanceoleosa]
MFTNPRKYHWRCEYSHECGYENKRTPTAIISSNRTARAVIVRERERERERERDQVVKMAASNDLQEILKPFYQRASEAEDRLARLEAAISTKKDAGNEDLLKMVTELQSKLESVKAEQVAEKEKAIEEVEKLRAENAKLKYQISHLIRALKEADSKLASK